MPPPTAVRCAVVRRGGPPSAAAAASPAAAPAPPAAAAPAPVAAPMPAAASAAAPARAPAQPKKKSGGAPTPPASRPSAPVLITVVAAAAGGAEAEAPPAVCEPEPEAVDAKARAGTSTTFAGSLAPFGGTPAQAEALEAAVHAAASAAAAPQLRQAYLVLAAQVRQALARANGPFPDDQLGRQYASGRLAAAELVAAVEALRAAAGGPDENPRQVCRRLFVQVLCRADPACLADRARTLALAERIETACYNEAIRMAVSSEEPPHRIWSSPPFVDIYSTRCGIIAGALDPASSTCQQYGARVAARVLSGELTPERLGGMTPQQLCPEATAGVKAEIERRSAQKVEMKASTLYKCPRCGVRRCTYTVVQLRGPDEPSSYQCTCLNCGSLFIRGG